MVPRKRRMLVYGLVGLAVTLTAAGIVFWKRGSDEPYQAGERIEGITATLARDLPPDHPRVEFVDVAEQAGIRFRHFHGRRSTQLPEDMGSGAAWGDWDGDGFLDLVVTGYRDLRLYRNSKNHNRRVGAPIAESSLTV